MADIKKYLDMAATQTLVEQIKAEDTKTLNSAKAYADSLANNYESAGSVATAKTELQGKIDEVQGNVDSVNTALTEEIARAKKAEEANATATSTAQSAADKAQDEVDALETYVGTIPEGATATDVISYVQERTAGIATESALAELQTGLAQAQTDIDNIEKDYLKAADKTELQGKIDAVDAKAVANAEAIDNIEKDYLVEADKTELQGKIDAVQGNLDATNEKVTTLIGEDTGKSARTIANEELAKQLIAENAKESLDTLAEIAAWIQAHPDDASAMSKAIDDLEALIGTLPEGVTATTIVGYIQEVVAVEQARAEGVESGLDTRIKAIETQLGDGEGSVSDQIADAKTEAIGTSAADATTKANTAESNAKTYTDEEVAKDRARLDSLEADTHTHTNKAELDLIAAGDKAKWDDATSKAHEHANKAVLDGITSEKVSAWNASEKNAKDYADGLNADMTSKVDAIGARVTTVEGAVATKAEQANLTALTERVTTAEAGIAENKAAIAAFTPIPSADITALFA